MSSVNAHNNKVSMCRELYFRVWKKIDNVWGLTLDNYLVVISEMTYLDKDSQPRETIKGAEIIARIEGRKLLPLSGHEKSLFTNRRILSCLDINDLSKNNYDRLAKEFDMSTIPEGPKYREGEVIENLLM